ncbi:pentatricopeptide repeat-containing protein [Tanacetum coccineum]
MPKATTTDISLTKSYIPKVYKIPSISPTIAQFYKPIKNRNIDKGRVVDQAYYKSNNIERLFTNIRFNYLFQINEPIIPRFILDFYSQVTVQTDDYGYLVISFIIQHEFITLTLAQFGQILKILYNGQVVFTNEWDLASLKYSQETEGPYCTNLPTPDDIRRLLELERVVVERLIKSQTVALNPNQILTKELSPDMKQWEELIRENVFGLGGHRDCLSACLAYMLYCVVVEEQYNLAYFFVKRIECARATPTVNLPYGMFLTRLYRYVMETYPHLDNGTYDIVERVMRPLALKQTRRPRSDHGKARHFVSSTSAHHNLGSSSHQGDDGASRANLSADLLRKALAITPVNPSHPFELPPTGDTVLDFVNELGYPEPIEFVSSIRTNYVYQPWRAILSLLNQCLTGKTSGSDKPRHPVLQMLWGIVTQTNVDHAELIWEEFTQGIQTFFSHKASHKTSLKNPTKKATPLLIPYGRFSKVIIYYLARNNNIHRRPDSAVHHTGDDYVLGNLKFVPKGETVEVFGMAIPDPLITEAIQQSSYYPNYLKMVAANTKKTPRESASVQPATKRATPKKPTTTTPVKQSKPAPPPTKKPSKRKLPQKVRKGKPTFKLVDEDDEDQQETIPHEEGNDPDLELAMKLSLETPQEKGEGEGDDADLERAIKLSLDPALLPQGRAPVGGVTIRDPVSETTSKPQEVVGKGKAVVSEEQVAHSLVNLSKKKRTTDQFVFARRDQTPPDSTTGPSSQPEDDTSEKVVHESSSTSDSERTESETETAAPQSDKGQDDVNSSTMTSGVSIPVSVPEKDHEALVGPDPEPRRER